MNDYKRFFNHIPGNLEPSNYQIFEPDSKAEILHWFSREDKSYYCNNTLVGWASLPVL